MMSILSTVFLANIASSVRPRPGIKPWYYTQPLGYAKHGMKTGRADSSPLLKMALKDPSQRKSDITRPCCKGCRYGDKQCATSCSYDHLACANHVAGYMLKLPAPGFLYHDAIDKCSEHSDQSYSSGCAALCSNLNYFRHHYDLFDDEDADIISLGRRKGTLPTGDEYRLDNDEDSTDFGYDKFLGRDIDYDSNDLLGRRLAVVDDDTDDGQHQFLLQWADQVPEKSEQKSMYRNTALSQSLKCSKKCNTMVKEACEYSSCSCAYKIDEMPDYVLEELLLASKLVYTFQDVPDMSQRITSYDLCKTYAIHQCVGQAWPRNVPMLY